MGLLHLVVRDVIFYYLEKGDIIMSELTTQPAPSNANQPVWRPAYCEQGIRTEELQLLHLPPVGLLTLRVIWFEATQRGEATICNDGSIAFDLCRGNYADQEHFKRVAYNAAIRHLTDVMLSMANQILVLKNTEPTTVQD